MANKTIMMKAEMKAFFSLNFTVISLDVIGFFFGTTLCARGIFFSIPLISLATSSIV